MREIKIKSKDKFIYVLNTARTVWRNDNICYNSTADIRGNKAYPKYYKTVFIDDDDGMPSHCGMFVVDDIEKEWNDKDKFYYLD